MSDSQFGDDILLKMTHNDHELLDLYARGNSQEAFTELVRRHLNLIYSAALRQVRAPQLAEEVAQSVFSDLARNAMQLKADTILTAWLYQVTRRTAIDVIRRESRRQARERIATEIAAMNTDSDWSHIEPLLDEAMETLDDTDRTAVLLRFFENKSLREVGATLGTSDDAAQKRVSRAVDCLRKFFDKRGVNIGASGLAVVISANAIQAAPVALITKISTATILTGTAVHAANVLTVTKAIAMTTIQKTFVTAAFALAVGAGIYEVQQTSNLRDQVQMLQRQQVPLNLQIQRLQQQRDAATAQLAALTNGTKSQSEHLELLKLRGEVTRLRNDAGNGNDATQSAAKSWMDRVTQLKERIAQHPELQIPELKLIGEDDWLAAVKTRHLDTEGEFRHALSTLRYSAENEFASKVEAALQKYGPAHNGSFPTDISQLQPYFDTPMDDAMLQRWQIAPAKTVPNLGFGDTIITQKSAVDDLFDQRIAVGLNGFGSTDFLSSETQSLVGPVYEAYTAANKGKHPASITELLPYATTPEQQAALQKQILRNSFN